MERQAAPVKVMEFKVVEKDGEFMKINADATLDLTVRVACSAGTYVRTLAEDLGKRLGVGAHLAELRRTRAGYFKMEQANTLSRLTDLAGVHSLNDAVIRPDNILAHLPALNLSDDQVRRISNGIEIQCESKFENQEHVRLRDGSGRLVAVGVYDEGKRAVHPKVVLAS